MAKSEIVAKENKNLVINIKEFNVTVKHCASGNDASLCRDPSSMQQHSFSPIEKKIPSASYHQAR